MAAKPAKVPAPRPAKATTAKPAPAKARVTDKDRAPAAGAAPSIKLKEVIDRVVQAANLKKKDVKPVVEATLKVLGDALASGEAMLLPPLGRLRVSRAKDMANGAMLTLRLKRGTKAKANVKGNVKAGAKADDGLADEDE
jgi:DNA-binding protein HU-alpha